MGCKILETASGVLACGEIGDGKLLDPELLLKEILSELSLTKPRVESSDSVPANSRVPGAQKRVLITSGGTSVPIDRVRSITNHSTGKTGAALCEVFAGLGYAVTLLAAKSAVKPRLDEFNQIKSQTIEFETFSELQKSLEDCLVETEFDIVIHAAAVSDYSLADGPKDGKVDSSDEVVLRLKKNPKLLDSIRKKSKNPRVKVVGFKFTAGDADRQARAIKVAESGAVDFLVTNDLSTYPNWEFHSIDQINRSLNLVDTGSDRHELGILISQKVTT